MSAGRRVLMIGLDAAELSLVRRWTAEGHLPALARLMQRGRHGALETETSTFAGGVWPTFYTGRKVPWHGIYHNKLWRFDRMRCEIAHESWLPDRPFWDALGASHRVTVLDVPMTLRKPHLANGRQLAGWSTHDLVVKGSWPTPLWGDLTRRFGSPIMPPELFGPQTPRTLVRLREDLLRATEQLENVTVHLLENEPWDLFVVVASALHRGGHYLWDLSQLDATLLDRATRETLEGALLDLYRACDSFVERCCAHAGDAHVIVFAVHGMGPNLGWSDRCADLVSALQRGSAGGAPKTGLLYAIKRRLPWGLVREVTTRLPQALTDRLVGIWSARMFDWATTRYFPLPMDAAGYVRVNLRGREPAGIVEPGAEYDALCEELRGAFLGLRQLDTNQPIVRRVHRAQEIGEGPYRDGLPDLVVEWADAPASRGRGVSSDRFGDLVFTQPGRLPSGRAGNHRDPGWFVAAGEGIEPGEPLDGHHVIDLAPTVLHWLGAPAPVGLQGRSIPELARALPATPRMS